MSRKQRTLASVPRAVVQDPPPEHVAELDDAPSGLDAMLKSMAPAPFVVVPPGSESAKSRLHASAKERVANAVKALKQSKIPPDPRLADLAAMQKDLDGLGMRLAQNRINLRAAKADVLRMEGEVESAEADIHAQMVKLQEQANALRARIEASKPKEATS